jgi:ribulose-phosphate 3-epimerase
MAKVVPTVLAATPEEFATRLTRAESLSPRVHVDITDGHFTDGQTINLAQVHAGAEVELDLHLMLQDPAGQLETALSHHPKLIIFHFESTGDLLGLVKQVQELGVRAGVALLPQTPVELAAELIKTSDHVLIFTGHLGHNGGAFQADQLEKVAQIRALKPNIEVSVDGGVSDQNAPQIVAAGVDVLYAGGYLQAAANPQAAYESLQRAIGVTA